MRYAVVIEKAEGNFSAYVPDLPGCVATGETVASVEHEIREAIRIPYRGPEAGRARRAGAYQHRRIHRGLTADHASLICIQQSSACAA